MRIVMWVCTVRSQVEKNMGEAIHPTDFGEEVEKLMTEARFARCTVIVKGCTLYLGYSTFRRQVGRSETQGT